MQRVSVFCGKQNRKSYSTMKNKFCDNECNVEYRKNLIRDKVESNQAENSGQVKKYLVQKYGHICMDTNCAWDFQKRPIKIELEHIDGNSENNKLENCILLCPNCHSTTLSYKAKNKGNGRHKRRQRYQKGKSF